MSIAALAWARKQVTGSPTRKSVLRALADYANDRGEAWPALATLVRDTELSERAIRGALRELEAANVITRRDRHSPGEATRSALYFMDIDGGRQELPGRRQDVPPRGQELPPRGQDVPGEGAGAAALGGQELPPLTERPLERSGERSEKRAKPRAARAERALPAGWPDDFRERFWQAYPHKVGKAAALKVLDRIAKKGDATLDQILAGVDRYVRAKDPEHAFCNPATFLNQERWNDQPAPPRATRRTHRNGFLAAYFDGEDDDNARHDVTDEFAAPDLSRARLSAPTPLERPGARRDGSQASTDFAKRSADE